MNKMYKLLLGSVVFLCLSAFVTTHDKRRYHQERAQIECNPREFSYCTAITARARRGETYKTNVTLSIKNSWNNNVSTLITFKIKGTIAPYKIQNRLCEMFNIKWITEFMLVYSDIPPKCPLLPGIYHFVNIELPPKNFPVPIPDGKTLITQTFYLTDTKEMLSRTKLTLITSS